MSKKRTPKPVIGEAPVTEQPIAEVSTDVPVDVAPVEAPVDTDAPTNVESTDAPVVPAETPTADVPPEVPVEEPAPIAEPVAPAAPAPAPVVDDVYNFLKKKYGAVLSIPTHVQSIIDKMDAYVKAMGANVPVTEEAGTRNQLVLFRVYSAALDVPNGGHMLALDVIVWYVSKHREGAFSDRLAARFLNTTSFPPERQRMFVSLTNLFTILANPLTRRELNKHVNMDVVARNLPSITQRRNLVSFVSK